MSSTNRGTSRERLLEQGIRHDTNRQLEGEGGWKIIRGHLVAISGEFIGTTLFLWFAFAGAMAAIEIDPEWTSAKLLLLSLDFGMSLTVAAWVFYRISGGLFNPAVTLAMIVTQTLPLVRGLLLLPTQIAGGIAAAALVHWMLPGSIEEVITTLGPGVTVLQGFFIEMLLTSILVFTILMLAAEKHNATHIAPVGIGLSLFVAEMAGIYYTGGALNPARAFGPCVVTWNFETYHYIYWAGPFLGGVLAGVYYKFIKYLKYEEANPGQDDTNW